MPASASLNESSSRRIREKRLASRDSLIRDSPVDVPPQTRLTVARTYPALVSIASSPDPSTPQGLSAVKFLARKIKHLKSKCRTSID
jgi:hypothetical protein